MIEVGDIITLIDTPLSYEVGYRLTPKLGTTGVVLQRIACYRGREDVFDVRWDEPPNGCYSHIWWVTERCIEKQDDGKIYENEVEISYDSFLGT